MSRPWTPNGSVIGEEDEAELMKNDLAPSVLLDETYLRDDESVVSDVGDLGDETLVQSRKAEENEPEDKGNLLYLTFVLLGAGFLVPYSAIIAAIDYFKLVFPEQRIEFDFVVSYLVTNFVGMLLGIRFGPRLTFTQRLIPGYAFYMVVLMAVPFFSTIPSAYPILLILMIVTGLSDALVQTGGQGYAGLIGPLYSQAIQVGFGLAGLIATVLRIGTKLALPDDFEGIKLSAMIYFGISAFIELACIGAYFWSLRSPITKWHLKRLGGKEQDGTVDEDWRKYFNVGMLALMKKLIIPIAELLATFAITLTIYPGAVVAIESTRPGFNDTAWFPVILITVFNVADFIGKTLPRWIGPSLLPPKAVHVISIARILFIPLFIIMAKRFLVSDMLAYLAVFTLAFSGGYIGSYNVVHSHSLITEKEGELTTMWMNVSIVTGLCLGSLLSLIVKAILG